MPLSIRALAAALLCLLCASRQAPAQTRWTVDTKGSLAWWQVDPNLNHLWATTCPEDGNWRPGEGRSAGWSGWSLEGPPPPALGTFANVSDTIHVPLYPRRRVRLICTEAVTGQLVTPDTATWRGARGDFTVNAKLLVTGESMRDVFTQNAVLETPRFPYIRFVLDSLVGMSRTADTLRGTAVGTLALHGLEKPMVFAFTAYPQAGGTRVLAKARIPAQALLSEFGMSRQALGLGVVFNIWKILFIGVDLLLHAEPAGGR